MSSSRLAQILGSSWRREPAAALRGLAKGASPCSSRRRLSVEHLFGHIDLAPDDEPGQLLRQDHGDGLDGPQILRHVLPHPAVAPGGPLDKHPVPILQGHAQAVHLGLHAVLDRLQGLLHAPGELLHLLGGEHVLEALQGHRVLHLPEALQGRAPHPLGGGVGGDLLRVGRLQLLQAAEEAVVLVVRHGGIVQHIVAVTRLTEGSPQIVHFTFVIHCISFRAAPSPGRYPLLMAYSWASSSMSLPESK